ncbi:MAG: hypothetical protein ACTHN5_09440 [Phycisphaerae bacterium]
MGIFEKLTHSVNRLTHWAGVRAYLNHEFRRYGHMTELKIDDEAKRIEVTVMLKGEKEPIHVHVDGYVLDAEGGTVTVEEVRVSREWMDVLAKEVVKGRKLPLPEGMGKWAKLVL